MDVPAACEFTLTSGNTLSLCIIPRQYNQLYITSSHICHPECRHLGHCKYGHMQCNLRSHYRRLHATAFKGVRRRHTLARMGCQWPEPSCTGLALLICSRHLDCQLPHLRRSELRRHYSNRCPCERYRCCRDCIPPKWPTNLRYHTGHE
jgi:hypothetical protein